MIKIFKGNTLIGERDLDIKTDYKLIALELIEKEPNFRYKKTNADDIYMDAIRQLGYTLQSY